MSACDFCLIITLCPHSDSLSALITVWWVRGCSSRVRLDLHHGRGSLQPPVPTRGFPAGQSAVWRPDGRSSWHLPVHGRRHAGVWLPGVPEHRLGVRELHRAGWVVELPRGWKKGKILSQGYMNRRVKTVQHWPSDLLTFWLHRATCQFTKEACVKHCVSDNRRLDAILFSLCLLHDVVFKFLSSTWKTTQVSCDFMETSTKKSAGDPYLIFSSGLFDRNPQFLSRKKDEFILIHLTDILFTPSLLIWLLGVNPHYNAICNNILRSLFPFVVTGCSVCSLCFTDVCNIKKIQVFL